MSSALDLNGAALAVRRIMLERPSNRISSKNARQAAFVEQLLHGLLDGTTFYYDPDSFFAVSRVPQVLNSKLCEAEAGFVVEDWTEEDHSFGVGTFYNTEIQPIVTGLSALDNSRFYVPRFSRYGAGSTFTPWSLFRYTGLNFRKWKRIVRILLSGGEFAYIAQTENEIDANDMHLIAAKLMRQMELIRNHGFEYLDIPKVHLDITSFLGCLRGMSIGDSKIVKAVSRVILTLSGNGGYQLTQDEVLSMKYGSMGFEVNRPFLLWIVPQAYQVPTFVCWVDTDD